MFVGRVILGSIARILESSCAQMMSIPFDRFLSDLNIQFMHEPALVCILMIFSLVIQAQSTNHTHTILGILNYFQGPGVRREWFSSIAREFCNPNYGLLTLTEHGTYHPSALSSLNPDHLNFMYFIGSIIGLAIYQQQVCTLLTNSHLFLSFFNRCVFTNVHRSLTSL
jgi:hypothetical protein